MAASSSNGVFKSLSSELKITSLLSLILTSQRRDNVQKNNPYRDHRRSDVRHAVCRSICKTCLQLKPRLLALDVFQPASKAAYTKLEKSLAKSVLYQHTAQARALLVAANAAIMPHAVL